MILDPKTSKRIFELARVQQEELEGSEDDEDNDFNNETAFTIPRNQGDDEDEDEEDDIANYSDNDLEEIEEIVRLSPACTFVQNTTNHPYKGSRRRRPKNLRRITSVECR